MLPLSKKSPDFICLSYDLLRSCLLIACGYNICREIRVNDLLYKPGSKWNRANGAIFIPYAVEVIKPLFC